MGTEKQPDHLQYSKYIFAASFIVSLFWITGNYIDVHTYKLTGVVFEILWLPMIVLFFVLPVLSVIFWYKQKFNPKSLYVWSLLMIAMAAILIAVK